MDEDKYTPYVAPLFRGATKSAMLFGVPLVPLVAFAVPIIACAMVTWQIFGLPAGLLLIVLLVGVIAMREMSKRDDQYLNMFLLDLREKGVMRLNRLHGTKIFAIPPQAFPSAAFVNDSFASEGKSKS